MSEARIIDGKAAAARLREQIAADVEVLKAERGITPGLAAILVGDDPASGVYVRSKVKACDQTGIAGSAHYLPADTSAEDLSRLIDDLNDDPAIHGILLQLPLPGHLDPREMIRAVDPKKDVDGLHPLNVGKLMAGMPCPVPCTPQGVLRLLKDVQSNLRGLHAVVLGRSLLFGKPMAQLLLNEDCTVTQCHSKTQDIPSVCRQADILIPAVGRPEMVKGDWIKPGAIVLDVGINRLEDGSLTGDVAFDEAAEVAQAITPVPGGVGPMTIACLLQNTLEAARANG